MKKNRTILLNAVLTLAACTLITGIALAQKPEIVEVDLIKGAMEDVVTLKGSSFGTNAADLAVFFGAQKATIKSVTNQLLEVSVPPGTTYDNISVTNLTNKLTGYSTPQFLLSFSGNSPFNVANLGSQQDFNAADELYDHCLCDFNNDGKVDVATANRSSVNISILQNTSTGVGNINFVTTQKALPSSTLQIKCGDLNADGLADLVVTEGTKLATDTRIYVLQNTGGFTFSSQTFSLTGQKVSKIDISDLDRDGRPDVIVTDQSNGKVIILQNTSNGGITMDSPVSLDVAGAVSTDGIAVEDLNGDHLPEIVTSQFGTSPSNIYIAVNNSVPGSISFGAFTKTDFNDAVRDIKIADIDGDRKADIVASRFLTGQLTVFLNTTVTIGGAIAISKKPDLTAQPGIWGFDVGDVDGDGRVDIVGSSVSGTKISISSNQSTPGNVTFVNAETPVTFITRHTRVGDFDGDGKPEISFCSVDKSGIPASKVSVLRNQSCVLPKITPETTPVRLCTGVLPYKLTATMSKGSFYQWFKNGVQVSCGLNQNTFDVTSGTGTGLYSVKILAEGTTCSVAGTCSLESNVVDIIIGTTSAPVVSPTNNGPICIGSTLNLSVTNNIGDSYSWTGPDGFTATGATVSIPSFQLKNAGKYEVTVTVGTCIASKETTVVEAIDVPNFVIGYTGSNNICQGDPAKTLQIVPNQPGFTYQWKKDGVNIGGATGSTFSVTSVAASSGAYTVEAKFVGCSDVTTPPVEISVVAPATASITAPTSACKGSEVSFAAANNTGDVDYAWTFGDASGASVQNPKHTYATANAGYTVTLIVSYDGACPASDTHTIEITEAPAITITSSDTDNKVCEGESITFSIASTFVDPVWSTGAAGFSITVTQGGEYFVTAKAANGCELKKFVDPEVIIIPAPSIILAADPQKINEGETSQLSADGLLNYEWSPPESLTATNIPNPVAQPTTTTLYTVTGLDENGCPGSATITLTVIGEAIVNKLVPKNFFSPNNSGPNDFWFIENILDFPQCAVAVYDDKGVKVFEAKPYVNDWNGMFNGKELPDGVYFYVIRCEGEENSPRTGSITLIR